MYKLIKSDFTGETKMVLNLENNLCIPLYDPANTDYANFKKAINEETAELQDADGNTMSAEDAKAYVATLP